MEIFVRKLNLFTTNDILKKVFSKFGKVNSVEVLRNNRTKLSSRRARVQMDDRKSGVSAIEKLNGFLLDGRNINVSEG